MKKSISDYHIHTPLCNHASGEPAEYCEQAIKMGLEEIGFSDHAPLVAYEDPNVTMQHDQLPDYYKMMEMVKNEFNDRLRIKIGIEADFIPGYEARTKKILDDYPYDFVIGSVHFIDDWAFDNPDIVQSWSDKDVDQVYINYYEMLRQSAATGLFNIMGHVDLVKKFKHRPGRDLSDEIEKTAKVFKDSGVAVEINTAGLRKPAQEMYPAARDLAIYCVAGVPLTFGSDAHTPDEVGKDFDKAIELARSVGYTEYALFKQREIERVVKID